MEVPREVETGGRLRRLILSLGIIKSISKLHVPFSTSEGSLFGYRLLRCLENFVQRIGR